MTKLGRHALAWTLLAGACAAPAQERTPEAWLDAMNEAFRDLSYDGVFTYFGGSDLATLRVVHLIVDGVQRERLVHLNGAPREIIRVGNDVTCILQPGDEILELGASIPAGPYARAFSRRFDAISELYEMTMAGEDRIAGRQAVRIAVVPRDENRYGYRLWLDRDTAMLLRSELHNIKGMSLEIFQFASLIIGEGIPVSALEPDTREGSVLDHLTLGEGDHPVSGSMKWHVGWVPDGFKMASADIRRPPSTLKDVNTIMYSDGLAAFSVFVESMPEAGAGNWVSRDGATVVVTYLTPVPGMGHHLVTVVGELPTPTAKRIAQSIYYRP